MLPWAQSVSFGGPDLREFYIVTGSSFANPSNLTENTGMIFRSRPKVAGQPKPPTPSASHYCNRAFSRGPAKSRKARSFSGTSFPPPCSRLTGCGDGSKLSRISVSLPSATARAT